MRIIIVGMACIILSIVLDASFLPHQSLWNDEATQLAGLTLNPVNVTKWLAGNYLLDSGVGGDRMPPLSYYAGWTWSQVFGPGERSMRWFGVTCVAIATGIVYAAATRAWGMASGVAAALLLATSPNVIWMSVEIRTYPVLILASSGLFACLIGYTEASAESRKKWLIGMTACGVAATYLHFFGLVVLGGCFLGAFIVTMAKGEKVLPIVAAGCLAGLLALGLGPFVFASRSLSETSSVPVEAKLGGLVRLIYRLVSHPSTAVSTVAVALSALGLLVGVCCGLAPKRRSGWASVGVGLAIASGLAVVMLAHMVQSLFPAASPSYNIWVLPALGLFIASGLAAKAQAVRITSVVGILMLLAANSYGTGQLLIHGDAFAHNPHRHIAALIRQYDPQNIAVIHDDTQSTAWEIYAPIRSDFGRDFHQYVAVPDLSDGTVRKVKDYPARKIEADLVSLPFPYLMVIRAEIRTGKDIAPQLQSGVVPIGDGPTVRALLASGVWERVEEKSYLSLVAADVDVFRKVK